MSLRGAPAREPMDTRRGLPDAGVSRRGRQTRADGQSPRSFEGRWEALSWASGSRPVLFDGQTQHLAAEYDGSVENFIGTVKVPVGVAGPLLVRGSAAEGDYYVPLATTEAALVASYNRGAKVITAAGGCEALVLDQAIGRSPAFVFEGLADSRRFADWVASRIEAFREVTAKTTRFGRLESIAPVIDGNYVYLHVRLTTGDAAGQNMVTFATAAICDYILTHSPVRPRSWYLEANVSGDKKASHHALMAGRGWKVVAEAVVPAALVQSALHTTPQKLNELWRVAAVGSLLSGTLGVQAHFANALAALFIATGQDVACVAESAVGVSRFDVTESGDLYGVVTLPNLVVGTVGGGTGLPSQRACLEILGLSGEGRAPALAEVVAATCLAGELSLAASLCAGSLADAHNTLARGRDFIPGMVCDRGAVPDD